MDAEYQRKRTKQLVSEGKCSRCRQPNENGLKTCNDCLEKRSGEKYGRPRVRLLNRHMTAEQRFHLCYVKRDTGCWDWTGPKAIAGYGRFRVNNRIEFAHRFSYRLHHGELVEGMVVMHSCDNPKCVNPEHLSQGTKSDNALDMYAKGRHPGKRSG